MQPLQLARSLKRIASGIENSRNPKKELVIRDLKRILVGMEQTKFPESIFPESLLAKVKFLKRYQIAIRIANEWEHVFKTDSIPEFYLIRVNGDGWALTPFDENVSKVLKNLESVPSNTILSDLHGEHSGNDVSVVFDPEEWDVEWMNEDEIDHDVLRKMLPLQHPN